ncbi:MAG: tRNA (guanosine(37)-N1)-methyltransferase TrmD [Deltaproteobacteria bacterium]
MKFDILTIFPRFFESPFSFGILKRAQTSGLIEIETRDIRAFAEDRHRTVDDAPYGGGGGMVMKPEPLGRAIEAAKCGGGKTITILTTPQGERFSDKIAEELSSYERIILICGRYEGIDERIREVYVDREISIGDFIVSGGEYAAAAIIDAVSRYIPGVLGNEMSPFDDSFRHGLLEHPQYTRPEVYKDRTVPEALLSGNHREIEAWKRAQGIQRTAERRADLLDRARLSTEEQRWIRGFKKENPPSFRAYIALIHHPVYNKSLEIVSTAFTNLDVHDIARAGKTYGIEAFFLVHPVEEQRSLAERVIRHWMDGPGVAYNPTRNDAMRIIKIKKTIEETLEEIEALEGAKPKVVVTDGRPRANSIGYGELREQMWSGGGSYVILFGTGWGLAESVMARADFALKPIEGTGEYNHLSVRSAAAIILDRLFSDKL